MTIDDRPQTTELLISTVACGGGQRLVVKISSLGYVTNRLQKFVIHPIYWYNYHVS